MSARMKSRKRSGVEQDNGFPRRKYGNILQIYLKLGFSEEQYKQRINSVPMDPDIRRAIIQYYIHLAEWEDECKRYLKEHCWPWHQG